MKVYVIRHGQDVDNANDIINGRRDLPLTPLGRRQAAELSSLIRGRGLRFSAVYTSPLLRAKETARIVSQSLHMNEPIVHPDLIESDFGALTGKPTGAMRDFLKGAELQGGAYGFVSPPGGETLEELTVRANRVLTDVEAKHDPDDSSLLVSHGDFGKILYASYYGIDWRDLRLKFRFRNCDMLLLSPELSPGTPSVIRFTE